jgi:NADPH:quinone reductase-like Zn-dependent oxidoreductase
MKRIDLIKTGGFAPTENLVVSEVDVPKPGPKELLIDVKASAINPVDWKMAEYGFLLPETLPAALGCDVAGVVVDGPDEWKGKRVVANVGCNKSNTITSRGAYVDKVLSDIDVVFEIPDSMSFAQAASLPVGGLTAIFMLDLLHVSKGDWVLVWGASSSVGFHAVQLAAKSGLKVIAVASRKHEAELKEIGAAALVDYRKDDIEAKVKEIVGTDKLNGAVDCIGIPESFGTSAKLVDTLGDKDANKVVSSVTSSGLPEPPAGVARKSVLLAFVLENEIERKAIKEGFPRLFGLKPQTIRSVEGPLAAETLQKAFQINKDGVSNEKVVIEWTK